MTPKPAIVPPAAIAVIGLGNMGVPMGACLIKAGFAVTGFDLSETARRKAVDVNHACLYAGMGAVAVWLNHSCSVSVEAPTSRTRAASSADNFSNTAGETILRTREVLRKQRFLTVRSNTPRG